MACRLFGAKPSSEPMLPYCQLDPKECISLKFNLKFKSFHEKEMHFKMSSAKWRPFCLGLNVLRGFMWFVYAYFCLIGTGVITWLTKCLYSNPAVLDNDGLGDWVIKFNSLSGDSGQQGPKSPYKPCNLSLYIGIIIFPHIDNTQSTGQN